MSATETLNQMQCEACQAGAPQVDEQELPELLRQIPDWQPIVLDGVMQLQRQYKFRNFKQAWAAHQKVAELAEAEGHHPALLLEWGSLTVTWWTHAINGLHKNDFICAAKTDAVLSM